MLHTALHRNTSAYICVHIAALLFGLAGVLGDKVGLSALQVTFGRTLFATIALATAIIGIKWVANNDVLLLPSVTNIKSPRSRYLLLLSGVLLAFHWTTFFASIQASTVAIGLVMFSTCPVFVALLEPWFFRERFNGWSVFAALAVLVGVLIISGVHRGEMVYTKGIALGIISGLSFALLQLVNRRLAKVAGSVTTSFFQNTVATILLLPFVASGLGAIQMQQWAILLFLGIGCTALAHTLFIYSLKHIKVAMASLIASGLEPLYGIALAAIVLSQVPGLPVIAGGAIILSAVILMTYSNLVNSNHAKSTEHSE